MSGKVHLLGGKYDNLSNMLAKLRKILQSWIFLISLLLNCFSGSGYFLLKDYLKSHPDAYLGVGRVCTEPVDTASFVSFCIFCLFLLVEVCSLIYVGFHVKKDGVKAFMPFLINLIIWLIISKSIDTITPNCA